MIELLIEGYGPQRSRSPIVRAAWVEGTHPSSHLWVRHYDDRDDQEHEEGFPLYEGELAEHYTTDWGATPKYAAFWLYHMMLQ